MPSLRKSQRGFTLVELSIVLVIIGLIIGGVLTGQQIIQNARITKSLNDIQAYESQFQTYQQNFGALPGDDPAASTRFPNSGVQNGNGDGTLQSSGNPWAQPTSATTSDESYLVWQHLRAAGIIKNQIGLSGTAVQPPNPFGGMYRFQSGAFNGVFTTPVLCLNNVPASAALAIDTQLDDGAPDQGGIRASTGGIAAAPATDYSASGPYVLCIRM